jgi:linoleoyl-CoA desaturase
MNIQKPKFSRVDNKEFADALRIRVNNYFNSKNISKNGNANMALKTTVMLSLYFVPLILMLTGVFTNPWLIYFSWIVMGFGMAGIGMNIMHDSVHGSYSKNKTMNRFLGYSMNVIGANASMWQIQHNQLHHGFTNIDEVDMDIAPPKVILRFSPNQERYWIHRFQHFYVWFFYSISTLIWVTSKDFVQIFKFKRVGLLDGKNQLRKELRQIILWKLFYYSYMLVLPMLLLPVSPWFVLLGFVSMHAVTGFSLSVVFQLAHVMPTNVYPLPDEKGMIEKNWAVHQMMTTSNFSPKSRIFSWFIGGLNYQIEHHLFANVCHVHYKNISPIVVNTAKEYGIPYHTQQNFILALWNHYKMLRYLGRVEYVRVKN